MTKLFFDICLYFKPDTLSMENVDNILSPEHEIFLKEGMDRLIEAEYQCVLLNVSAASFGDPQERKRCILIAVKKTMPFDPNMLKATHGEEDDLKGFVKSANVFSIIVIMLHLLYSKCTITATTCRRSGPTFRPSAYILTHIYSTCRRSGPTFRPSAYILTLLASSNWFTN